MGKFLLQLSRLSTFGFVSVILIIALVFSQILAALITWIWVAEIIIMVQVAAFIIPALAVPLLTIPSAIAIKRFSVSEKRFQEKSKKLRDIVFSSGDWIWEVDKNGKYTYVLGDTEKILGIKPEEMIGKTPFDMMPEEEKERVGKIFQKIIETQSPIRNLSNWNIAKNGERVCMLTNGVPLLDEKGELIGYRGVDKNITNYKKAERRLLASEKRFREFAEMLPEMVCETDLKGNITFANNFAYKQFSYTEEDLENGLNVINLFIPEHKKLVFANFKDRLEGKGIQPNEYVAVSKNGKTFPVLVYTNLIMDNGKPCGLRGVMIDISDIKLKEERLIQMNEEIKQANEEIATQNEELHSQNEAYRLLNEKLQNAEALLKQEIVKNEHIFEFTPSATFTVDKNKRITKWNKQAEKVTGFTEEDVLGKDCSIFALDPCTEKCGLYAKDINKPIYCRECIIKRKDGTVIIAEKNVDFLTNAKGEIIGGIESFHDVTERKKYEEKLKEAKKQAEDAAKAKTQFLSTMSHEIRTPMNAVIGMTHLLQQENPLPEQIDHLKTLRFSAENLLVLINDILDYNKIESGKISFEEADFNMNDVLDGIVQSLSFKAIENDNKLMLLKDAQMPSMFVGDSVRLTQILTNLVGNANKFTQNGTVTVETKIQHETENTIDIYFAVKDTGIGIPKDKQKLIFDRFTQASSDTTRKFGGTGLGLAITKKLIELQGGKIELESEVGKGSNFFFTLSFKKSAIQEVVKKQQTENQAFDKLVGIRILLVEDNTINVFVAKKFLSKWEVIIDEAENGLIAIDKFANNPYDIILMDLQMPEMNGYDATMEIRKTNPDIPIIALTASVMSEEHKKAFDVGMNDFITKPFNPTELYSKILEYVKK